MSSKESLKLYSKVRIISIKEVSLVTIKNNENNILNLAVATRNRVAKMRMNLKISQYLTKFTRLNKLGRSYILI